MKNDLQLSASVILKYDDDDVKELVHRFLEVKRVARNFELILSDKVQEVKILTAENKFLKEDLDSM